MTSVYKSSATSLLALLEERDPDTRIFGLEQLDVLVDELWPLVADGLEVIVSLAEDSNFAARELAALLASKVYYHLGQDGLALQYALAAGKCFNVDLVTEYTQVIVAKAVGEYINWQSESLDLASPRSLQNFDADAQQALEALVVRLIAKSVEQGQERHAIGICIECRRLDLLQRILENSKEVSALIKYLMTHIDKVLADDFKFKLYACIIDVLHKRPDLAHKHYTDHCTCLYKLGRVDDMAALFESLVAQGHHLVAKQLAFDLVEIGDHALLRALDEHLAKLDNDDLAAVASILNGFKTFELYSIFLRQKNHTDIRLLEHLVANVDQRSSILHHALVLCHGFMQSGTRCDVFLRNNLSWLAKANNWARFSATASLGVVHKNNFAEHARVLQGYLPSRTSGGVVGGAVGGAAGVVGGAVGGAGASGDARAQSQGFSEGGSLYALGLIHANFFHEDPKGLLIEALDDEDSQEPLLHGGALGLGLVCMGTRDDDLYKKLQTLLYKNNATSGQAAAIGMGMVMLGSGNESVIDDLAKFMDDTDHEKITRACSLSIGLVLIRRPTSASLAIIKRLASHSDSTVRFGAMFAYGLAFCNTSSSRVIKELLYIAVSDTCDNVRRAAVIAIAFVMCNCGSHVPRVLKLLAGSYNIHVRYGVALALGIACAATAQADAVAMLVTLSNDKSDVVRQGAYMSLGLVLQGQNYASVRDLASIRDTMRLVATDKHQDIMARFGAIVGLGLMDAGGQNCVATMYTGCGHLRLEAVVGFCLFAQHWYWHPFLHMITLAFSPACFIGITQPPKSNRPPLESPNCGIAFAPKIANLRLMITLVAAGGCPLGDNESFKGDMMHDYIPPFTSRDSQLKQDKVTAVLSVSAKRDAWKQHQKSQAPAESKLETSSVAATMGHSSYAASSVDLGDVAAMDQDAPLVQGDGLQQQPSTSLGEQAQEQEQEEPPQLQLHPNLDLVVHPPDETMEPENVADHEEDADADVDIDGQENEDYEGEDGEEEEEDDDDDDDDDDEDDATSCSSSNIQPHVAVVQNPCRLIPWQQHLYKVDTSRFIPALHGRKFGIVLMHDSRPNDPDDNLLMASDDEVSNASLGFDNDASPFEPFEWQQAPDLPSGTN